jgi:hypothetical protein
MSEKNLELMKKVLEKKKEQQGKQQSMIPDKKLGSGSGAKKNQRTGWANKKV